MINRAELKMRAKQSLSGNIGVAIGVTVVSMLILGLCNIVPGIGAIASLVLTGVIGVGLATAFLNLIRGKGMNFQDLFAGFKNFGTPCVAGILVNIFTVLWSLLLIIPGIIKGLSYSMTYFIIVDHPEMAPNDAIKASMKMMDGHKMDLFVLYLSFILWGLLCAITFGLAFLYVGPYMQATLANFYEEIKNEKNIFADAQPVNYNAEPTAEDNVNDIPKE